MMVIVGSAQSIMESYYDIRKLRDKARFAKRFAILFMRHLYVTNPSISYISYECLVRKVRTLMYLLERYSFVRLRVLIVGSQACTKCEQDALGIV
jgi:hypothetical protein